MNLEINYFRSILQQYLNEHHPEMMKDESFIASRSEEALTVYLNELENGASHIDAEATANEVLYNGLHFSGYDMLVEVLWNEFADSIPQGLAERLGAILWGNTAIKKTFAKYKPDDNFDNSTEYNLLYTELTGVIQLIIEQNKLPVLNINGKP